MGSNRIEIRDLALVVEPEQNEVVANVSEIEIKDFYIGNNTLSEIAERSRKDQKMEFDQLHSLLANYKCGLRIMISNPNLKDNLNVRKVVTGNHARWEKWSDLVMNYNGPISNHVKAMYTLALAETQIMYNELSKKVREEQKIDTESLDVSMANLAIRDDKHADLVHSNELDKIAAEIIASQQEQPNLNQIPKEAISNSNVNYDSLVKEAAHKYVTMERSLRTNALIKE